MPSSLLCLGNMRFTPPSTSTTIPLPLSSPTAHPSRLSMPFLRPYTNNKLEYRSSPYIFLGYNSKHKGYQCLHVPSNRIYIARRVIFDETTYPHPTLITPSSPSVASPSPTPSSLLKLAASPWPHTSPTSPPPSMPITLPPSSPLPIVSPLPSVDIPSSPSPTSSSHAVPPLTSSMTSNTHISSVASPSRPTIPSYFRSADNNTHDMFIKLLNATFSLRDLGDLHYFLGVEVVRSKDSIMLSQQKYTRDLLHRSKMHDAKPISSPSEPGSRLVRSGDPLSNPHLYCTIVRALQ
ncbi:hypothetical protein V2J09_013832 [Rumex salicifolius]